MSARDQSVIDRAPALWGHHQLLIEQFTRIPRELEFRFELRDTFSGRSELVGLHTGHARSITVVDEGLLPPVEKSRLRDAGLGGDRYHWLAGEHPVAELSADVNRVVRGIVSS